MKLTKKVVKSLKRLPESVAQAFEELVIDLEDEGPVRGDWPNYSKLINDLHHCHLSYRYVAVWRQEEKRIKTIEVIYVGSRENAPY